MKHTCTVGIVLGLLLSSCGRDEVNCDPLGILSKNLAGYWDPGFFVGKAERLWFGLRVLAAAPAEGIPNSCVYHTWVHVVSTDLQIVAEIRTDFGRQLVTEALMNDMLAYGFEHDPSKVFSISLPLNDSTPYENTFGMQFLRAAVPDSAAKTSAVLLGRRIPHAVADCVELGGFSAAEGIFTTDIDPFEVISTNDPRIEGRWLVADIPETPDGYAINCD